MVHRLLLHYMNGGKNESQADMEARCTYISQREQLATEAERASIKYKMVEFSCKIRWAGEFDGVITSLTEWGYTLEPEQTQVEGMVPLRDIQDDYYVFDKETVILPYTQWHPLCTGSKVRIRVSRANLEQKQLDFILIQ